MLALSAWKCAGVMRRACDGNCRKTKGESPELVPGRESAGLLLGSGSRVSSHRADLDELRAARSLAAGVGGRIGESLAAPRTKSPRAQGRFGGDGPRDCVAGRPS